MSRFACEAERYRYLAGAVEEGCEPDDDARRQLITADVGDAMARGCFVT
jgi:hypothetical protein